MSRPARVRLHVENLEERAVPAAAVLSPEGILTVTGSKSADTIQVRQRRGMISVDGARIKLNGASLASVPAHSLTRIRVLGLRGDDTIRLNKDKGNQPITVSTYVNGGVGKDTVYGASGDDVLCGSSGADLLVGGPGNDSLFGGQVDKHDVLRGGAGADRFLRQIGDEVLDRTAEDASVLFLNHTSAWTDKEIGVVDAAFAQLVGATGNTRLLQDPLYNRELQFNKGSLESMPGVLGVNATWGRLGRIITIRDFDETLASSASRAMDTVIHEIGHNWDSEGERWSAGLAGSWDAFTALSDWQRKQPSGETHRPSGDGKWWYRTSSESGFFGSTNRTVQGALAKYGSWNPNEDWATALQDYFRAMRRSGQLSTNLPRAAWVKIDAVARFLAGLSSPSAIGAQAGAKAAADHLAEVLRQS